MAMLVKKKPNPKCLGSKNPLALAFDEVEELTQEVMKTRLEALLTSQLQQVVTPIEYSAVASNDAAIPKPNMPPFNTDDEVQLDAWYSAKSDLSRLYVLFKDKLKHIRGSTNANKSNGMKRSFVDPAMYLPRKPVTGWYGVCAPTVQQLFENSKVIARKIEERVGLSCQEELQLDSVSSTNRYDDVRYSKVLSSMYLFPNHRPSGGLKKFFFDTGCPRNETVIRDNDEDKLYDYFSDIFTITEFDRYNTWLAERSVHNGRLLNNRKFRKVLSISQKKEKVWLAAVKRYQEGKLSLERLNALCDHLWPSSATVSNVSRTDVPNDRALALVDGEEAKFIFQATFDDVRESNRAHVENRSKCVEEDDMYTKDEAELSRIIEIVKASDIRTRSIVTQTMKSIHEDLIRELYDYGDMIADDIVKSISKRVVEMVKRKLGHDENYCIHVLKPKPFKDFKYSETEQVYLPREF